MSSGELRRPLASAVVLEEVAADIDLAITEGVQTLEAAGKEIPVDQVAGGRGLVARFRELADELYLASAEAAEQAREQRLEVLR